MHQPLTDTDAEATIREAALACLAAGIHPSRENLRRAGARGGWSTIRRHFNALLDSGVVELSPRMVKLRTSAARRHFNALLEARVGSASPVRCRKPVTLDSSPCAVHIRDYRAAWRRITRTRTQGESA